VTARRPVLLLDAYVEDDIQVSWGPAMALARRPVHRVGVARGEPLPDDLGAFAAVLVSGSAACLPDGVPWIDPVLPFVRRVVDQGVPMLGVCFGHQVLAEALGGAGSVAKMGTPEVGVRTIEVLDGRDPLLGGFGPRFDVMVSHEDEVPVPVPSGLTVIARSVACDVHGVRVEDRPVWGVQFHSEMPRSEVVGLLHRRARRSPEMGLDPAQELARYDATPSTRDALFGRFFSLVDGLEAGHPIDGPS